MDYSTVDEKGDLWFTRGEGLLVSFGELDDLDAVVSPATHPRYLSISSINYYQLIGVDPADSNSWRIALTPELLAPVELGGVAFSVIDNQGTVPVATWSGVIRERNLFQ